MAAACLWKTGIGVDDCFITNNVYAYFLSGGLIMFIQYGTCKELFSEEKGFGKEIIDDIIDNVTKQAIAYCQIQKKHYKDEYDIDIDIDYNIFQATQAIIDTLEDLKRLKEFHPVKYPNRLKCAAYLAYWWIRRKPITFSVSDEIQESFFEKASKEDIAKFIHSNEFWLVAYVFGEIFSSDKLSCSEENPEFDKQWNIEFDYIFYYFCYRADSAKSIEAFLSTSIMHPIWIVKEGVHFEK